jgi:hypothetical protein
LAGKECRPCREASLSPSRPCCLAAPAAAKDVCVTETGPPNVLVFKNVKKLKKPGTAIPLQGVYLVDTLSGTQACALSGAATVISDGSVWFGATAHCLLTPDVGKTVQFGAHGSADFNAGTHVDRDGDGTVDNSDGWMPIDCKTVVLP